MENGSIGVKNNCKINLWHVNLARGMAEAGLVYITHDNHHTYIGIPSKNRTDDKGYVPCVYIFHGADEGIFKGVNQNNIGAVVQKIEDLKKEFVQMESIDEAIVYERK